MTYEHLLFERKGSIGRITLNRPQRRNALSLELMLELMDVLDAVAK